MRTAEQKNRVLVIGDIILDIVCEGLVERISPEAPVPVVKVKSEFYRAGGAANVANNIASLGAEAALIGAVGADSFGEEICKSMSGAGIESRYILKSRGRCTNTKTRVIGNCQQIVRMDCHDDERVNEEEHKLLIGNVKKILGHYDVIVLSDYGKGICSEALCREVIRLCSQAGKAVLVDPKGKDWEKYTGATMITPNLKEVVEWAGVKMKNDTDEIVARCGAVFDRLGTTYLLITRSECGMTLLENNGESISLRADAKEVFDVSGAGDTVIAAVSAFWGRMPLKETLRIANTAAGIVVGKRGTAAVTQKEIERALGNGRAWAVTNKIMSLEEAVKKSAEWKEEGKKVVFTNGCFDMFHKGHACLMYAAAEFGDRLIVGLNSDRSVHRLKGGSRPLNRQEDRACVIASMGCVDAVVIFDEDTPEQMLKRIRPDVLVKGGDYTLSKVAGREYAGEVRLVRYMEGYSTTALINKIITNEEAAT